MAFINCGNEAELRTAVTKVAHRGPDNQAVQWFKAYNSGLGHARLSIIDLSESANQPMNDRNSGNWIIFNGEIFNYKDIKKELEAKGYTFFTYSDTEVLLTSYLFWGENCLDHFNGMYSFVIYNERSRRLFAARDRLGIKPFYYYHKNNKLIIASEIKSILACSCYIKEPDYNSLCTQIHYQISPFTGFKDIMKLPAGYFLTYNDGRVETKKYWDIYPREENITYDFAHDELENLLSDSISLQMVSDVPVGALLSGGLDSSLISVMMQEQINQPLNTYTIKFDKKDLKRQGNVDDAYYAKKLAKKFSFSHHEIHIKPDIIDLLPKLVWHLDEPIADPAAINTYLISKAARDSGIKVLLTGMGADEVFSGYRSYLACLKADIFQKIPVFMRKSFENIINYIPESSNNRNFKYIRWIKNFLKFASLPQRERSLLSKNSALNEQQVAALFSNSMNYNNLYYTKQYNDYYDNNKDISYLTRMCYVDTKTYLTDHNLTYSDKAMMAVGVEGRPPLIDHRIVEFMFRLPSEYRIRNNIQKYLLKKVAEKYIPREIIYRPKAPFSAPMRGWLKEELKEMVSDILSVETIKNRGIYNPTFIQNLIKKNDQGTEDNSQLIWRFMVNEIWFRTFFN